MFATLAGGYPFGPLPGRTQGFDAVRDRWPDGGLEAPAFTLAADAYVREVAAEQVDAGLDMVEDAFARVPGTGVVGLASGLRSGSITPSALAVAWQSLAAGVEARTKAVLPGPWTLAEGWPGGPAGGAARERSVRLIAESLEALGNAGCPMVMLSEPALVAAGSDRRTWRDVADTMEAACLDAAAALHLCLAITGGAPDAAGHAALAASPFASHLVDVTAGPAGWAYLAALPSERGVIVGAVDAASELLDDPEMLLWAAALAAEAGGRGSVRVGIAPSGSMAGIDRHHARRKMEQMGLALRLARMGPLGEVARGLQPDPRASRTPSLRRLIADHDAAGVRAPR